MVVSDAKIIGAYLLGLAWERMVMKSWRGGLPSRKYLSIIRMLDGLSPMCSERS